MNKTLINNDVSASGIYRAILDWNGVEAKIYIPGLFTYKVNEKKLWLDGLFSSYEMRDTAEIGENPCWVVFENGDMKKPIIMGYFGKGIRSIGGSVSTSGNTSGGGSGSSNGSGSNGGGSGDTDNLNFDEDGWKLLGNDFKITYYCIENYPHVCNDGDASQTATGTTPTPGRTIAVDPSVIPYNSYVKIDNHVYIAEDCGGAIKGHRIDIVCSTHQEALNNGIRNNVSVYIYTKDVTTNDSTPPANIDIPSGVTTYSVSKDGSKKVSEHFYVREFASKDGADTVLISGELVRVLENIRSHFNGSVSINSAYRTASHNKSVGGASNSQHLYGTAADITVSGATPSEVYAYADKLLPNGGVGKYSSFTHVDVRGYKSRW